APQHVDVDRLVDEVEGPGLERAYRGFDIAEGGDHGGGRVRVVGRDLGYQVDAGAVGQAHVGQAQVVAVAGELRAGLGEVGGGVGAQPHAAQGEDQQFADVVLVVDDQGAGYWVLAHARNLNGCRRSGVGAPLGRDRDFPDTDRIRCVLYMYHTGESHARYPP